MQKNDVMKPLEFGRDATEISETFITSLGFNSDRVKLSNPSDVCTKEELHQSFLQCAKKFEQCGNFIFYFAGHGFECKASRCILVPADFNNEDENLEFQGMT